MIYPPFIYARKWNSHIEGKVASRLFFLMQIIEVFTRRFPGVLLEAAAEITRVVESRAISDFGDAHLLVFLHVLKGTRDACGNIGVQLKSCFIFFTRSFRFMPKCNARSSTLSSLSLMCVSK